MGDGVPDGADQLLALRRVDGRKHGLRRRTEGTCHPLGANAIGGERGHEVLRGARHGLHVLVEELLALGVLRGERHDQPLGHALGRGALVLVEAAQLGLGLRAARVEAPRLGQEVVRREDCRGRDELWSIGADVD